MCVCWWGGGWRFFLPEHICTEESGYDRACLLSPHNNCLWITWGESRWRCLETTPPGRLLESRSYPVWARGFDSASPDACVCVSLCSSPFLFRLFVCVFSRSEARLVVSFIALSVTHTPLSYATGVYHTNTTFVCQTFLICPSYLGSRGPDKYKKLSRTFICPNFHKQANRRLASSLLVKLL